MPGFAYGGRFECTVYQCSACGLNSPHRTTLVKHLETKCPGATILQAKCALTTEPPEGQAAAPKPPASNVTLNSGTNNGTIHGTINVTINNYTVAFPPDVVYHGSDEELLAACHLLFSPEFAAALRAREDADPQRRESLSSLLFKMLKSGEGASPRLRNLVVTADRVYKLVGPGKLASEPRRQYVKKTVGDMHGFIDYVAKLPYTPDLNRAKDELHKQVFTVGKTKKVSALDVASMQACGSQEMYRLDAAGKAYIDKTRAEQDRHLDDLQTSGRAAGGPPGD